MRVAFIHISDFHFRNRETSIESKARLAIRSVASSIGRDGVRPLLLITGDIAFSGKAEEYTPMRGFIQSLLDAAHDEFDCEARLALVPGNHDIRNPWDTQRELREIIDTYQGDTDEFYRDELHELVAFFDFARSFGIDFDTTDGSFINTIELHDGEELIYIRLVCLSSSPCSTKDAEVGKHLLPDSTISKIPLDGKAGEVSPYTVLLMHHPERWFADTTLLHLRSELENSVDFLFTGHEHMEDALSATFGNASPLVVSRAGEFARDDWMRCTFSCVLFNTKTHVVTTHQYTWNPANQIFVHAANEGRQTLAYPKGAAAQPLGGFIEAVAQADEPFFGDTFLEYFQFPAITEDSAVANGPRAGNGRLDATAIDERSLFKTIASSRVVNIVGRKNSGKTTLLKFLYLKSLERGYSPLFLNRETARRTLEVTLAGIIREQYGEADSKQSAFNQQDSSRTILFVDDFHLLKRKADECSWIMEALQRIGRTVIVTEQPLALESQSEESFLSLADEYTPLVIHSFTKSRRDVLIYRVCEAKGIGRELRERIASAITHTVSEYRYMFQLNPDFTLQYLKHALEGADQGEILLRCEKPFGEVYRSNIESLLRPSKAAKEAGYTVGSWKKLIVTILGRLAYSMHSSRNDAVQSQDIASVISQYLDEYAIAGIETKEILSYITGSSILEVDNNGVYHFKSSNHLAFFVANDINARLDYSAHLTEEAPQAKEDIERIIDEVGYGINETIVLFLSYLRESVFIPLDIMARASALVANAKEARDFSFVRQESPVRVTMPGEAERKASTKMTDTIESQHAHDEPYSYLGLYDYRLAEPNSLASAARAAKYLELASRVLSSSYITTRKEDKEIIVTQIYSLLGKVIGLIDSNLGSPFDDIVDGVFSQWEARGKGKDLDRQVIRKLYTGILLGLSVGIITTVANAMLDSNAIDYACGFNADTALKKIYQLMMLANHPDPNKFCSRAVAAMKDASKRGKYADQLAIYYVVTQFIIARPSLPLNLKDKLANEVYGGNKQGLIVGSYVGRTR